MSRDIKGQPVQAASLLGLPPPVRRRIYLHLGIARHDGHPNVYCLDSCNNADDESDADDDWASSDWGSHYAPPPLADFHGLLQTCRALHEETARLLYSANRFIVFYSHQGSLEPLRALSPVALASLTWLKIVLNETSCHQRIDPRDYPPTCCHHSRRSGCPTEHGNAHGEPLLRASLASDLSSEGQAVAQAMFREWHDVADYISSHVGVASLELSLVCDIDAEHQDALETARLAVAPITLFRLKDCHVRLCGKWNRPLQELARDTVLQSRQHLTSTLGASPLDSHFSDLKLSKTPSPLTSLPAELRLRILEYTDLITPWKEVTWSRQDRGYIIARPPCDGSPDCEGDCPPRIHHGCRLSRCNPPCVCDYEDEARCLPPPGCFCRRRHSAFSFTCNCWAPPTDLFLLCQSLCRDAQFVFFSGNRFIVHDYHACEPWSLPTPQMVPFLVSPTELYYPFNRLAASEFLHDIVPVHCLPHLRFLELVFPPYIPGGWPQRGHPAIQDWGATVEWMRGKVNAPALTIRVVMADFGDNEGFGREDLTDRQGEMILDAYTLILEPLKPLVQIDALAGFYAHAAYPWRWAKNTVSLVRLEAPWEFYQMLAKRDKELKEVFESLVRGGKIHSGEEPGESMWRLESDN